MVGLDWLDLDFFFHHFFQGSVPKFWGRSQNLSSADQVGRAPGPGPGPMGPHGAPWGPMGPYGALWGPMGAPPLVSGHIRIRPLGSVSVSVV